MTADLTGIEDNSLSPSQHLFVWLLRTWFRGMVMGQDTTDFMAHVCFDTGIGDAVDDLDEFFAMIASGARRQYSVGCDQCTHVHRFEVQLVNALAALQRNEWDHATYLIEFYVKPDEAYMAGPPAYRLGAAMALAGWDIEPLTLNDGHSSRQRLMPFEDDFDGTNIIRFPGS